MKLVFLLALTVGVVFSSEELLTKAELEKEWSEFKLTHSKKYVSAAEEQARMNHFHRVASSVKKHNREAAAGKHSYWMSTNAFSDLSREELHTQKRGAQPPKIKPSRMSSEELDLTERQKIPAAVDLRTNKCMPAIKDQKNCGSCYAFVSITPLEYALCKKKGKLTLLSEQQLVDCSTTSGNFACNGGGISSAWNYVMEAPGEATSAKYRYTAKNGTCKYKSSMSAGTIVDYALDYANVSTIQKALTTVGPVAVGFQLLNSFYTYSSGVYSDADCPSDRKTVDHGLVIVGYGKSTKKPYWIVRNSWGPTWGIKGYALIERGVNMCNIEYFAGYITKVV